MKWTVCALMLIVCVLVCHRAVHGFRCYSCQGGPLTNCAEASAIGVYEDCAGRNAQCYEALVAYQRGALTLVQRRCWQPPKGSNDTNFCDSFDNPVGELGKCITCTTDLCNTDKKFWL
ncbi:uncharacterized protein LOC108906881 isoform X1 [Anoplophora glabripennis]|uniref:uncharacterized protein LOC108906881 isoform X1 n=1 Tax=Anoplophora glabripennis TaxID=217634 RepID=UPI000875A064|nr:uncharacterized protein LOC108906881 isoform X1 [Anoplophora glabripennis]